MLGSNFVAQIVLEASDSICAAKALFNPWMIDTMKTTVITPTLTPRIVKDERSLFVRTVSSAMNADSLMSMKVIRSRPQRHRDSEENKIHNRRGNSSVYLSSALCLRASVALILLLELLSDPVAPPATPATVR